MSSGVSLHLINIAIRPRTCFFLFVVATTALPRLHVTLRGLEYANDFIQTKNFSVVLCAPPKKKLDTFGGAVQCVRLRKRFDTAKKGTLFFQALLFLFVEIS